MGGRGSLGRAFLSNDLYLIDIYFLFSVIVLNWVRCFLLNIAMGVMAKWCQIYPQVIQLWWTSGGWRAGGEIS